MGNNYYKKRIVVEKRQSSLSLTCFTYQNDTIDMSKLYPYSRTIITNNQQFKFSINKLCKNTSRAMYTLLGNVNKPCEVKFLIDLFDIIDFLTKMMLPLHL